MHIPLSTHALCSAHRMFPRILLMYFLVMPISLYNLDIIVLALMCSGVLSTPDFLYMTFLATMEISRRFARYIEMNVHNIADGMKSCAYDASVMDRNMHKDTDSLVTAALAFFITSALPM